MDATRARRTRDRVRQVWYARWRQQRFARFLGFIDQVPAQSRAPRPLGLRASPLS
jgi:hypothetical protein